MVSSYEFRVSPDALGFYSLEESVVVKERFLPLAKIKISPLLKRGVRGDLSLRIELYRRVASDGSSLAAWNDT